MRYRWLMILLIFPVLGAGQDSIRTEAKRLTNKQIDSIKQVTKHSWYMSPTILTRGLERKLLDANESILLELRKRNKLDDSVNRLRDSLSESRYKHLVALAKEREEKEQLRQEKEAAERKSENAYYQPLMLGLSLSTIFLALYIIFLIKGMFDQAKKERKAENVEKPDS